MKCKCCGLYRKYYRSLEEAPGRRGAYHRHDRWVKGVKERLRNDHVAGLRGTLLVSPVGHDRQSAAC